VAQKDERRHDPANPDLDAAYEAAVERWLRLDEPERISRIYDEDVFPLALARMERQALSRDRADLLILPVGTQRYSPRLVTTAIPAASVGLVATPEALEIAKELEESLRGAGAAVDLRVSESGGVSRAEVAELAIRIYRTAGEPDPSRTVVDLTSGRKPTVAALASTADALGATSCYLEATFHRPPHGGYATGERLVFSLPLVTGPAATSLDAARTLGRAGLFRQAAREIGRRGRNRYLPPETRAARHAFLMCDALTSGDARRAALALRRAVREASGGTSATVTKQAWAEWGRLLFNRDEEALAAGLFELARAVAGAVERPARRGPRRLRLPVRALLGWLFAAEAD